MYTKYTTGNNSLIEIVLFNPVSNICRKYKVDIERFFASIFERENRSRNRDERLPTLIDLPVSIKR